MVLLPSPDGSIGRVLVKGQRGKQVLTQALQGAPLDGSTAPFQVNQQQLSHGEHNLLVATPDNTAEPPNHRVAILLR